MKVGSEFMNSIKGGRWYVAWTYEDKSISHSVVALSHSGETKHGGHSYVLIRPDSPENDYLCLRGFLPHSQVIFPSMREALLPLFCRYLQRSQSFLQQDIPPLKASFLE